MTDVEAFRAAWQTAAKVEVSEKPSAAVLAALDRLAEGVRARALRGSTAEASIRPFAAAIGTGESTSDPASLDATTYRDGDRLLVDVRMGYASSVSAFDRAGRRLLVPASLRWSYRQFGPFFRVGSALAFDATSLSDAGVRYSFRLGFLRRTVQGYVGGGTVSGFSTYDFDAESEPRLIVKGGRVVVNSLDSPRSFFVSNADRVLRRSETWDATGPVARRVATRLLDPDLRAVDDWLWAHRGSKIGQKTLPREPGMATDIRRDKGRVEMDLDSLGEGVRLHFEIALVGGRNVVQSVTIKRG